MRFYGGESEQIALTMPAVLKRQLRKLPLPKGVKWSDVWQVMLMAAVAEKKGLSDDAFDKQLAEHPRGQEVRDYLRRVLLEYIK